ncbi:uncharacterized protein B0P05DRAFT_538810 [Gilbertella persicaria]|uniref:uncharacterized protein n=1 Tax=Gilbertella persicaria TaxID=101096 RepID=UPI0022203870|nr:uncharacterized protein B0P05DRAFT_538810 [Gilbertella persicaria]KAI8081964.1 hypothetical protein B0P05DRAFT_538810 [Gilbertella persicaria]
MQNLNEKTHSDIHIRFGLCMRAFVYCVSSLILCKMNYGNDNRDVFICSRLFCCFNLGNKSRQAGVYFAGMLFALGWWVFIDGLSVLWNLQNRQIAPGIEDWVPGIITTFGMIIVNLIDKEALKGNLVDDEYIWRARLFLFFGFAMMAGGFSGSVAVLVTKYIYNDSLDFFNTYLGITDVVQCFLIMLSAGILWLSQSSNHSQQYYFQL